MQNQVENEKDNNIINMTYIQMRLSIENNNTEIEEKVREKLDYLIFQI